MLKGATHNLYRGGPEDYSAWTRDINALDPDLLLLQESCDPARYTYPSALWAPVEANRCGSAIHLKHGQAVEVSLPAELRGWVIGAEVRELAWYPASPGALYVFSLHAPDRPSHNYEREVNAILDAIAPLVAGHTVIIGGDFNLTVSARHGSEERRNTSGEEAIHRRLREEFGLINCWQTLHPDEALPADVPPLLQRRPAAVPHRRTVCTGSVAALAEKLRGLQRPSVAGRTQQRPLPHSGDLRAVAWRSLGRRAGFVSRSPHVGRTACMLYEQTSIRRSEQHHRMRN